MSISPKRLMKKPLIWLYAGGVLLLLVGGGFAVYKNNTDPERVFWNMIENNLATRGVSIQATESSADTSVHQTLKYSFGASNMAHSYTVINQQGTVVHSEMIGTPSTDYTRYVSVQTDQKNAAGQPMNFKNILGVWAKDTSGNPRAFPQAVLGTGLPLGGMAVPIGDLTLPIRNNVIKQIRDDRVYQIDFKKVKKEWRNGRQIYTYDVSVQAVAYAALMKQFAKDEGMHQLDQLDPSTFAGRPALQLQMTVDVMARRLVSVKLPANGFEQTYSAYDVPVSVALPEHTITMTELQKRLSELQ